MRAALVKPGISTILIGCALAAICLVGLSWRIDGGRWYDVATPSMGQAAPVGTLLLTRHTSIAKLHVGDIVTFHPPGTSEIYSHRVAVISATGIKTKGDVNPSLDPWVLHNSNLIGRVVARWWGMGWVLRGLPLLLICLALTALISVCMKPRWRAPARVIGGAVSVSVVAWVLHPWVGLTKLDTTAANHGVLIRSISTGILPTRAKALNGGTQVHLVDGQVGTVHVLGTNHHGAYLVSGSPSLSLLWWLIVIAICLSPLLWCLMVGLAPLPPETLPTPDSNGETR